MFHISYIIIPFLIRDPSPQPVGWWSSMSSFLIFFTYKKYLFFRGITSYTYAFILILLSGLMLKTVKTNQPRNPCYIFLMEVPHVLTLTWNHSRGINHSRYLLLRVPHLVHLYDLSNFFLVKDHRSYALKFVSNKVK